MDNFLYNVVVLGLIPGTNIQITFQLWLNIAEGLFAVTGILGLISLQRKAHIASPDLRPPLHAKQLHSR